MISDLETDIVGFFTTDLPHSASLLTLYVSQAICLSHEGHHQSAYNLRHSRVSWPLAHAHVVETQSSPISDSTQVEHANMTKIATTSVRSLSFADVGGLVVVGRVAGLREEERGRGVGGGGGERRKGKGKGGVGGAGIFVGLISSEFEVLLFVVMWFVMSVAEGTRVFLCFT